MTADRADIAVVGAGIIGCMVAREAGAREPAASVVLLDRDSAGQGASRRSAGLHIPRGATPRVRRMTRHSQAYYERLLDEEPALPIRPLQMRVVTREADADRIRADYLDPGGPAPVGEPPGDPLRLPAGYTAWHTGGSQYADVPALVQRLTARLRPGVAVREGVAVLRVVPQRDGVLLHLSTGGTLSAGRVVLAPGPWTAAPAWRDAVAPEGVRVKKVVALHIDLPCSAADPVTVLHDEDAFLLPLHHRNHWLFSYTCREWDVDPDALAPGPSPGHLAQARELLRRYAPAAAERCTAGRVFCDAYSPGREPLVRSVGGDTRLVFAGAAGGSGYRLAPAIASEAADLLEPSTALRSHT
ncbi:NAD(P)/FAD-dependent oxidoreductase [Streptacidiphilus griseoplanus]|uniref:NAD(P)/FAD-dependent oxidoreductase n=1 Tax=Peterkaempfera griseoplana TaxID=66896 RepID=UPI0006E314E4|nr:FAD-binding oxidoreductase [Peterkaempfera griseoplana]